MNQGRGLCRYCGEPVWWFTSRRTGRFYACSSNDRHNFHNCRERKESSAVTSMMLRIVQTGYRTLALVLHPDKGGNHEDMTVLNTAVQRLRGAVK